MLVGLQCLFSLWVWQQCADIIPNNQLFGDTLEYLFGPIE